MKKMILKPESNPQTDLRYNQNEWNFQEGPNNPQQDLINSNNNHIEMQNQYPNYQDQEKDPSESNEEDAKIMNIMRNGFIRKVYGILTAQLLLTFFLILYFQTDSMKNIIKKHNVLSSVIIIILTVLCLICFCIMTGNKELTKKVPYNYLILFIITLAVAGICTFSAQEISFELVVTGILLTIASALAITFYSFKAQIDTKSYVILLYVLFGQLTIFGILCIFINATFLQMLTCLLCTLILGIYLVYSTQLIFSYFGHIYTADDYILASLDLYLNIIRLFWEILKVLANSRNGR